MQQHSVFGFTGARYLNAQSLAVVKNMATAATQSGIVYTGCAVGADAAAIAGAGKLARVFAVGAPTGAGFPVGLHPALATAAWQGNHITWLAGGPLHVPLVARLARRSLAMVRALALAGGALVAFPATGAPPRAFGPGPFPSCGSGTWSTVAAAALLGVPVFVVCSARPSAVLPVTGTWVQSSLFGMAGWAFVPATTKLI